VAAVVAVVVGPAIDQAKVGRRSRSRVRRVLRAGRREASAGTPNPDPVLAGNPASLTTLAPQQGRREKSAEAIPRAGRPPQGLREICPDVHLAEREIYQTSDDGDGGVEGEDAAHDRTRVAGLRVAARRPANNTGRPNSPE